MLAKLTKHVSVIHYNIRTFVLFDIEMDETEEVLHGREEVRWKNGSYNR